MPVPTCIVLTGATSGIGRATALAIAESAEHLMLHGIEPEDRVRELLDAVRRRGSGVRLTYLAADFGDPRAVIELASAIRQRTDHIDVLINNAARPGPPTRTVTDAGQEITFQTNYLAPVALTEALADLVARAPRGRIINVASATHLSATLDLDDLTLARVGYSGAAAYAHAKLALVTWTGWLAAHRPGPSVDVVSLHPGVISTRLLHEMFAVRGQPPEHAAQNIAHVMQLDDDNGTYYDEQTRAAANPQAAQAATQDRLHVLTEAILGQGQAQRPAAGRPG
jgi:NAD(P)-dependent dehydrogenase (short-subunit alcohol dehydrogenase family)